MGDEDRCLTAEHMDLVYGIAAQVHKTVRHYVELDELVSLGTTGLLEAGERYDPQHGTPFAAFAYRRIRGAIYDGLRKMAHVPRSHYRKLLAVGRGLPGVGRPSHAAHGMADPRAASADTGEEAHEQPDASSSELPVFLTTLDESTLPGDRLADPSALRADDMLVHQHLLQSLRKAVASLPESERFIIHRHYFDDKTIREAGEELGLSRSWTSRLHSRGVDRLRDRITREEREKDDEAA